MINEISHSSSSSSSKTDDCNSDIIDDLNSELDSELDSDLNIDFLSELNKFKDKLESLEKKMDRLLEILENDCKKMRDHIDFVENVYANVKTPFNYLMGRVNGMIYTNNLITTSSNPESILDEIK